ncbi:hypothetical protein CFE70_000127 [Pyrenophora teres f. teres 0-1]
MPMPTIEEAPEVSTERPETAMLFNRPDSAENLPPRRELPFPRLSEPRSSGSDSPLGVLSNAAQNLRQAMSHSTPITPPTSGTGATGEKSDRDALAAYVRQSDEGRRAALNEFIFRNLENDDFLTLVEDMETAWARTAIGM